MNTARLKGYQLLESNIEVFRTRIENILDSTQVLEWKETFVKGKGQYYPNFLETKNIDYNIIPYLISDFPKRFDDGSCLKQDNLLRIVSSVRDYRILILVNPCSIFNENSLQALTESLREAFKMLNIGSRFQEIDNQRIPNSIKHTKGSAFTRKDNNPKNDGYINIPRQGFEDVDVPF